MPLLNIVCPICTETFKNADDVYCTSCGHLFHFSCLNEWRRRGTSCPQCRHYNPTTHKLYLSFEDDTSEDLEELKEIRLKLKTSNDRVTEVMVQKNEAETNFMKLQEQFTTNENLKKELETRIVEMNDFENDFLHLQKQYTESSELVKDLEYRVQQLLIDLDCKSKEISLKNLKIESLKESLEAGQVPQSESILTEKIKVLEQKLKHITEEFQKEINTSTKLSVEKMKLESYIKYLDPMDENERMNPNRTNDKCKTKCKRNNKTNEVRKARGENNNQPENVTQNNSIFVNRLPLDQVVLPLKDIIINLAKRMKLMVAADDLIKVSFIKSGGKNCLGTQLVAEFKCNELKTKFLSNRHILNNFLETKSIIIGEYMDEQLRSLFLYAKEKLRKTELKNVFSKNNKVFASKFWNRYNAVLITSKTQVDELCDKKISTEKSSLNNVNVDENLYQL